MYTAVEWVIIGQALYVVDPLRQSVALLRWNEELQSKRYMITEKKNSLSIIILLFKYKILSTSCTLQPYQTNYQAY